MLNKSLHLLTPDDYRLIHDKYFFVIFYIIVIRLEAWLKLQTL